MLSGLARYNLGEGAATMRAARLGGREDRARQRREPGHRAGDPADGVRGLTPAEALIAATRTAAEALGLDEHIGTVTEGRPPT